ncbi:MAG TPA: protein-tyrosine phosphatase family protein [Nitrolancea sp.]|nr:protein-tyrosine phosphatase family protein [Nitrolancea sp.]
MSVAFPDGTVVRGAGLAQRDANATWRSFGLYLDARWQPTWPAIVVEWEDFGLPTHPFSAAEAIQDAFARASSGEHVEIGCAGGIGRTGTVLACMAVLAGVPPDAAVAWVRTHFRSDAIETPVQEAWVRWFAAYNVVK